MAYLIVRTCVDWGFHIVVVHFLPNVPKNIWWSLNKYPKTILYPENMKSLQYPQKRLFTMIMSTLLQGHHRGSRREDFPTANAKHAHELLQ